MKYIIAILAFTFCTNTSFAGTNPDSLNATDFINRLNQKKNSGSKNDRVVITLGLDNMTYKRNDSFNIKWFSPSIGAYFHIEKILNKNFSVSPGLGFNFVSYNTDFMIKSDTTGIAFVKPSVYNPYYAQNGNFKGGTFYASYIEMPIELRYRKEMKSGNFLKVAVGVKIGYNLTSSFDWNAIDPAASKERNYKVSSFSEVSSFRFGPTVRFGYSFLNVYAFYGINKMFSGTTEKNNSEFHPFSFGISINGL
jgi:Outer membrane protein beta-barrel domain